MHKKYPAQGCPAQETPSVQKEHRGMTPRERRGFFLCLFAGTAWGVAGCFGQYLMAEKAWPVNLLIPMRIFSSGILMLIIASFLEGRDNLHKILTVRRNLVDGILFGLFGIGMCQYAYFSTIRDSSAATATVLCYLGPVMVMLWLALRQRKWPTGLEFLAVILATLGTFFFATHGDPTRLVLSPSALFWGLLAALSAAIYAIQPHRVVKNCGALTTTGVGMISGGVALVILCRPWNHVAGIFDWQAWGAFLVVTLVGSVISFGMYTAGLQIIGPTRASILCAAEPLAAVVVSVLWLNVMLTPMDYLGFVLVISTIFILAIPSKKNRPHPPAHADPEEGH